MVLAFEKFRVIGRFKASIQIPMLFLSLYYFWFLAMPWGMQNLTSLTRDWIHAPYIGSRVLTTGLSGKFPNIHVLWYRMWRCHVGGSGSGWWGFRGRTNNKSKVRYQQATCWGPWNHTTWPPPSVRMALRQLLACCEGVSSVEMSSGCPKCSVSKGGRRPNCGHPEIFND